MEHAHTVADAPAARPWWAWCWLLAIATLLACGVAPDPQIADEFFERLEPRDEAWARVPCRDRAAKVERVRGLVPMALDLRARIREFGSPPPPQLLARMEAFPMLGRARDYRCVVQDFTRIDLKNEPDFEDARGLVANLYMLMGAQRLAQGRVDEGWAHVLEALELFRDPVAAGLGEHFSLEDVLRGVDHLLDTHPPSPATTNALIEAIDAAALPVPVICSGVRHELLTLAMIEFRVHFGQREREAAAKRYGLDFAMRTWRTPQKPGTLDRPGWNELRDAYDLMVEGCTRRPLGHSLQRGAEPMVRLEMLHPPTGVLLRVVSTRFNLAGVLADVRITVLARLRGRKLRHELGRDPTTAELALSFGRRPKNPWDGRHYTFVVGGGVVSVVRGPYRHRVRLDPTEDPGSGTSYPKPPKLAVP